MLSARRLIKRPILTQRRSGAFHQLRRKVVMIKIEGIKWAKYGQSGQNNLTLNALLMVQIWHLNFVHFSSHRVRSIYVEEWKLNHFAVIFLLKVHLRSRDYQIKNKAGRSHGNYSKRSIADVWFLLFIYKVFISFLYLEHYPFSSSVGFRCKWMSEWSVNNFWMMCETTSRPLIKRLQWKCPSGQKDEK